MALETQINAINDRLRVIEENKPLQEKPTTLQPAKPVYAARKSRTTSSLSQSNLPNGFVPLYAFYHGVPANTAKRWLDAAGVTIIRSHWIAGGHHFDKALDETRQRLAYEALHTHDRFKPCDVYLHET